MKLSGYVHCTKISPEFECQGQRSRSPETKNDRPKVPFFGSRPLGRGPRAAFFRNRSSGAWSTTPVGKSAHAV